MQPAATSVPGRATLLNFFSRPGRAPVPLRHRKQQGKKKSPPPQKTRTNVYGRPKTAGNAEERRKRKVNKYQLGQIVQLAALFGGKQSFYD